MRYQIQFSYIVHPEHQDSWDSSLCSHYYTNTHFIKNGHFAPITLDIETGCEMFCNHAWFDDNITTAE